MSQIDKTVFISYRRTNQFTALAIFKDLTARGYDVFFDYNSINSGDFEQIILREIEARGHFIIILTPSALERCNDPNDWVRREIEHALLHKRNIIPLMFEGFKFDDMTEYLTGDLSFLKNYNGLSVPIEYFDAAMDRLASKFLDIPIDAVLHPAPLVNEEEVNQAIQKAKSEPQPTQDDMTAEEYFERARRHHPGHHEEKIRDYNYALSLRPDFSEAYNNRGIIHTRMKNYESALTDFNKAIHLMPSTADVYFNRGVVFENIGDLKSANEDYTQYVELGGFFAEGVKSRIEINKRKMK